jgi:hypothetical protein
MGTPAYDRDYDTDYVYPLSDEDRLRVRIATGRGRPVNDFVVQYEAQINGTYYPVVRYDSWHGEAHRDLLDSEGHVIRKLWLGRTSDYRDIVDQAVKELQDLWEQYRRDFIGRMT